MRRTSIGRLAALQLGWAMVFGGLPTEAAALLGEAPSLHVPDLPRPPVVDGVLKPGEWDGAARVTGLVDADGKTVPEARQTVFFVARYDDRVYLAARISTPARRTRAAPVADGELIWRLARGPRLAGRTVYRIVVDPTGLRLDERVVAGAPPNPGWATGGVTRGSRSADGWSVELSVAAAALGGAPFDDGLVALQLERSDPRPSQNPVISVWPAAGPDEDPFRKLAFGDGASDVPATDHAAGRTPATPAPPVPVPRPAQSAAKPRPDPPPRPAPPQPEPAPAENEVRAPAAARPPIPLKQLQKIKTRARSLLRMMVRAGAAGDSARAETTARTMVKELPAWPGAHLCLARLVALRGDETEALNELAAAVDRGIGSIETLAKDPAFSNLRDNPRFLALLGKATTTEAKLWPREPSPFPVGERRQAWVKDGNVGLLPVLALPCATYKFGPDPRSQPVITAQGPAAERLRRWFREGSAAGNHGDLYDNRDGGHSVLPPGLLPQLTRIQYSDSAKRAGVHWGLATNFLHRGIVIGNASVAQTKGPYWRSLPRSAYMNQEATAMLYYHYTHNMLYVHPAHGDYGPGPKGDLMPANTPYVLASRGSSGSDKYLVRTAAMALAAYRPEVKRQLAKNGLLMPTFQMLLRRALGEDEGPDGYLTGQAHPSVFRNDQVRPTRILELAHELTLTSLPPIVQLRVVEEDRPVPGRDFFSTHGNEVLFDTPCAIARVGRSVWYRRRMVVSAEASRDPNNRPLTWYWTVLRGDPGAIRITPRNAEASVVELSIPYHPPGPMPGGPELVSHRVDIGAFVNNGVNFSAPGFITVMFLANEERIYNRQEQLLAITYHGADGKGRYVDPLLGLPKNWRDEYHYGADGDLTGWTRWRGGEAQQFTADGRLIVPPAGPGKPAGTQAVRYVARTPKGRQTPILVQAKNTAPAR